jgi:hypothetical protein
LVQEEIAMIKIETASIMPPNRLGRTGKWPVRKLNKPGMRFFVPGGLAAKSGHVLSFYWNKKAKWPRGVMRPQFRAVDGEKEIDGKKVKGYWFQRVI